VPVPSEIGSVERDDDHVPEARDDVLVAAGTQVGLGRLERVDPPDLYLGISAHTRRASVMAKAAATST
jgi:hypothetical protein